MAFSRSRKIAYSVISAALVLMILEIVSMAVFHIFSDRFTFYSAERYVLDPSDIELLSKWFDPRLGWSYRYDTPFSERKRDKEYGRALISSYGDSYTHCTDVGDEETWQHYLSDILEADVYNLGVGGYGTDQAYLRFLDASDDLKTEIVVIGLTPENINRIVNVYRPFYFQPTGIKLPKPRFRLEKGALVLLENPIQDREDLYRLADPDFIMKMGENDWWFNRDEHPVLGFPHLGILLNRRIWLEAFHGRSKSGGMDDTVPRPWENLWDDEAASELMYAILRDFIGEIRSRGSLPIVMISAMQQDVFRKFMTGRDPVSVEKIKIFCASVSCLCFDAVGALASGVSEMEQIPRLYNVHVAAEGNRIIAEAFAVFLVDNRLVESPSASPGE